MALTITLYSNHGAGGPLVLELPGPDCPEPVLDKPWPNVTFPACKLILHRGCAPNDTLRQVCCDTLEQACFDAPQWSVYDGLYDHRNFRRARRSCRKEDYFALTLDNQLMWLQTKTNQMRERPRMMARWTLPAGAEYLYIGYPDDAAPSYLHTYLFDTDEQLLHRRLCKLAPNCDDFAFSKISSAYAHRSAERFMAVYYSGDEISPAEQAVIDELVAFPKDDPLAFYDACMRHVPFEAYAVDRAGNRTDSYWGTGFPLGKGLSDFLNPETWREMNRFDDVFAWERYSSDMDEENGFGNIYSSII